jgi:hypothetical protein
LEGVECGVGLWCWLGLVRELLSDEGN